MPTSVRRSALSTREVRRGKFCSLITFVMSESLLKLLLERLRLSRLAPSLTNEDGRLVMP